MDLNNILINIPFQYIVVDEAHRLKNTNAKILAALKRLPCRRILLLTGTPVQNNTDELWSLLNYIEPDKFQKLYIFKDQFGDLSSADQIKKLHTVLKPYLLRRMKEDVESSIPPLQETIIDIEMTTLQKTIYRALYDKNKAILTRNISVNNSSLEKVLSSCLNNLEMQLRKCCNHPFLIKEIDLTTNYEKIEDRFQKLIEYSGKMLLLDKLLKKLKDEEKKVLIFSQFTKMLNLLEEYLLYKGFKFEKIDGSVKSKDRQNAIDRFNNPEKKRDVFLLSTKAGGLGINLTSANVVIIFDSDWNPQNDVQATARAHRIGQINEVQCYRLITSKTYEAEMLERASKKLGLDQAIFMGGDFHNKSIKPGTQNGDSAKLSKNEIEMLLKKGILGLIKDEKNEDAISKAFMDEDIEQILEKNSRIAHYSLINGTYTFGKSSFVSKNSDISLSIDDPKFWENVLKSTESESKKLFKKLTDEGNILIDYHQQRNFILKVSERVSELIEAKLNIENYNADEEKTVIDILNAIFLDRNNIFHKYYKEMATQWLYEVQRPSRRFKKMTISELDIPKIDKGKRKNRPVNVEEDGEKIFDEEEDKESFGNSEANLKENDQENKKIISNKEKEERLRKLCNYCERPNCIFYCEGFCKRSFHEECKGLVDEKDMIPGLDENNVHNFEPNETRLDEERLKKLIQEGWTCQNCLNGVAICFICKKKGSYEKKRKGQTSSNSELKKCYTNNCHKFYHLECLNQEKFVKYLNPEKSKFRCPLHYCHKCSISGDSMTLLQCFRCINAFHIKCGAKEKTNLKLAKKIIVCSEHENFQNLKKDHVIKLKKSDIEPFEKRKQDTNQKKLLDCFPMDDENYKIKTKKKKSKLFQKNSTQKVNYKDLNIPSPSEFNYKNHEKDWCRYCGARFSSNFTKGPWGPRTLCTIHYIEWNQKKRLNLSMYKTMPLVPIKNEENTVIKLLINI